jgi:hypothetical protein
MSKYGQKIYKLALQYILVNTMFCPNLMCIWVQKMLWGIEIPMIGVILNFVRDLSNCKQCMVILY